MRTLLPEAYHDLLLGYFFGGEYVRDPAGLIASPSLNDEQLSIICQTLVQNHAALPHFILSKVQAELTRFVGGIKELADAKLGTLPATGFVELANLTIAARHRSPPVIRTLGEFETFISNCKIELEQIPIRLHRIRRR